MQDHQKLDNLATQPCSSCGGQMTYDAAKAALLCGNCGSTRAIATAQDRIVEHSFTEALHLDAAQTGMGMEMRAFHCNTCGANTAVQATQVHIKCSFCGSQNVNEEAFNQRLIRPFGILPFKVVSKDAMNTFRGWIGKGWFHPNDLQKLAQLDKMDGVYIPFWTYDAQTDSSWTADAGYYYYETESYTDQNGNTQTRQVQRVRWEPVWGNYDHWFDDVTVVASGGIKQERVEQIYPYTLGQAVNYDPKFVLGWQSEVYAKDVKEGLSVAEGIMDKYIEQEIIKQIPGDTHRFLSIQTRKSGITFKHMLLPLWILAYQYNNKTYQVLVNGETGKISGEKPLSWIKIALAILVVLAAALAIYYFTRGR